MKTTFAAKTARRRHCNPTTQTPSTMETTTQQPKEKLRVSKPVFWLLIVGYSIAAWASVATDLNVGIMKMMFMGWGG